MTVEETIQTETEMDFSMNESEIHETKGGHQTGEIEKDIPLIGIKGMSGEIPAKEGLGKNLKIQTIDEMIDTAMKG